jgi:ribosomal protein L16 Arg81 hydroxylase
MSTLYDYCLISPGASHPGVQKCQSFEISTVFSIPERQHLAGELIGGFEQEGQVAEERRSVAGAVMRKRCLQELF